HPCSVTLLMKPLADLEHRFGHGRAQHSRVDRRSRHSHGSSMMLLPGFFFLVALLGASAPEPALAGFGFATSTSPSAVPLARAKRTISFCSLPSSTNDLGLNPLRTTRTLAGFSGSTASTIGLVPKSRPSWKAWASLGSKASATCTERGGRSATSGLAVPRSARGVGEGLAKTMADSVAFWFEPVLGSVFKPTLGECWV